MNGFILWKCAAGTRLARIWAAVQEASGQQNLLDYVNVDVEAVITEQLTNKSIVAQVRGMCVEDREVEEEEDEEETATRKVTTAEALEDIKIIKCYF